MHLSFLMTTGMNSLMSIIFPFAPHIPQQLVLLWVQFLLLDLGGDSRTLFILWLFSTSKQSHKGASSWVAARFAWARAEAWAAFCCVAFLAGGQALSWFWTWGVAWPNWACSVIVQFLGQKTGRLWSLGEEKLPTTRQSVKIFGKLYQIHKSKTCPTKCSCNLRGGPSHWPLESVISGWMTPGDFEVKSNSEPRIGHGCCRKSLHLTWTQTFIQGIAWSPYREQRISVMIAPKVLSPELTWSLPFQHLGVVGLEDFFFFIIAVECNTTRLTLLTTVNPSVQYHQVHSHCWATITQIHLFYFPELKPSTH